jgi:Heparinase II/III-like protein/Heparinase II/III N-terminus
MSPPELLYRVEQSGRRRLRKLATGGPARQERILPRAAPALRIRFFDLDLPYPTADEPIHWSRDYKNGVDAPALFYGDIDYRNEAQVGDSKYTWELNRHQFLVPWALEYQKTKQEDQAAAIVDLIRDWIRQNPRHLGINWSSSLELALRILSWGIALDLCAGSRAVAQSRPEIASSVSEQADYIRKTLSLFSSANNHLMGELIGLLATGLFFPEATGAKGFAEAARHRILDEALRQNLPDGVNREGAFYYHHYTLEYILTAMVLFERLGFAVPPPVRERARRMVEFVDSFVDDCGQAFEVGDRDDGAVTGLNLGSGVGVYESLLWTGYLQFGDPGIGAHAAAIAAGRGAKAAPDPKSRYWLPARPVPEALDPATRTRRRSFLSGGYLLSTDRDFTLMFKAGPFGYPSIAAHSHCDQLSVGLKHGCETVLTDAGTYVYHTEDRWRRFFRGTSAHNTVGVDGQDQAEYAGPFLWATHAEGQLEKVADGPSGFEFIGRHDGYARLSDPVEHERRVLFRPGIGYRVVDRLQGAKPHKFDLYWNLAPDISLDPMGEIASGQTAWRLSRRGTPLLGLVLRSQASLEIRSLRGDEAEPAGFESRTYLEKQPSIHLRATTTASRVVFETFLVTVGPFGASDLVAAAREWT